MDKNKVFDILRDCGVANYIISHHGDTIITELAEAFGIEDNDSIPDLSDEDLMNFGMQCSEPLLAEDWNSEEDRIWDTI
jgi:hypothetical protein